MLAPKTRWLIGILSLLLIVASAFGLAWRKGSASSPEIADWPPSIRDHFIDEAGTYDDSGGELSSGSTNDPVPKKDLWPSGVTACPFCGGPLVKILSVAEDPARPCKNERVFSYSSDSYIQSFAASPVCTRCWAAYFARSHDWELLLLEPQGFLPPLQDSIAKVPLPASADLRTKLGFKRSLDAESVRESVLFWCRDDQVYLNALQEYCLSNHLTCDIEERGRIEGQVCIDIEVPAKPLNDLLVGK